MDITIQKTAQELGRAAADRIAAGLISAIRERGEANYLVSTGSSQFTTFEALLSRSDVDWSKVTMFHLDEYVGLPEAHPASFRRYLKERFVSKVALKRAVFVDGEAPLSEHLSCLQQELTAHPIDVGVIGIGENAHIAFNDPPADFTVESAYHVVTLDTACKQQQVNEGWFPSVADVPEKAISMTPKQIMRCRCIVSPVPGQRKAEAILRTLSSERADPMIPATLLKTHPQFHLVLDEASASLCSPSLLRKFL